MRGSTHAVVGIAVGIALGAMNNAPHNTLLGCAVGGLIGGLVPDIDHMNSKLGRKIVPVSFALQNTVGHRTLTHSLIFISMALACYSYIPTLISMSIVAGVTLHIVCDALTPQGVPLLYPHPYRFRVPLLWRIRPITETATLLASVAVIGAIFFG